MNRRRFAGCEWREFILRVVLFAQGRVQVGFDVSSSVMRSTMKETVKA